MPVSIPNLLLIVSTQNQIQRLTAALQPEMYRLSFLAGLDINMPAAPDCPPDLVILWFSDVFPEALPRLKSILDYLKSIGGQAPIPVLIILDQYEAQWVEPVFQLGVTDILTRPIHPLVLRQRVRLLLQARETALLVNRLQESEAALQDEKERFRTVADFTYDWEYWSSPTGQLIYNSPSCERITGYLPQDFLENPHLLRDIVLPEDRQRFEEHQCLELETSETSKIDFQITTKNGQKCWIGHICQQVYAEDGRKLGRRVSNRDITERKLAESNLIRSERLAVVGRLTASLSHEINNPLQAIFSSIEILQEFSLPENERSQYLQIMRLEIERLMKINSEILGFSRSPEANFQPILLHTVIDHALFLASTQLRHAKISTEVKIPPSLPAVLASPDQMTQVFLNLIINAAEDMCQGGHLVISATENMRWLEIRFTDTGKGIHPEDLDLIFDPFFSTKTGGTGLGLSICQKIIQQHHGEIQVYSTPGSGSTFTVHLPVLPPDTGFPAESGYEPA